MKSAYKSFREILRETAWEYVRDRPIGQQWGFKDNFFTNGRGEGFKIHGGTKFEDKIKIVNLLNKKEYELQKQKKEGERTESEVWDDLILQAGRNGKTSFDLFKAIADVVGLSINDLKDKLQTKFVKVSENTNEEKKE